MEAAAFGRHPPNAPPAPHRRRVLAGADTECRADHVVEAAAFGRRPPNAPPAPHRRRVLAGAGAECRVLRTALAAADTGAQALVVAEVRVGVDDDSRMEARADHGAVPAAGPAHPHRRPAHGGRAMTGGRPGTGG